MKRVFLLVLDSLGIGGAADAADYGDLGSDTLGAIASSKYFSAKNLAKLGLFNIDGVTSGAKAKAPEGSFARLTELSKGKDTTSGHWEIAGLMTNKPFPTYPEGFPAHIIEGIERFSGRRVIVNKPYSGTEVIKDYGRESIDSGALIVYTSADSVLQIAAHESSVPVEELYRICQKAREICTGDDAVGRIIARPFRGEFPYERFRRHDYSLEPTGRTMLDILKGEGYSVIGVGKIGDIFAGRGITETLPTSSNADSMEKLLAIAERDFNGLCFVNLVDFDMSFGHRNDVDGYANAVAEFDLKLGELLAILRDEDILIMTADHGCDPSTPSTDHSRENVFMLACGKSVKGGVNLGIRQGFADIAATVLDYLGAKERTAGESFFKEIKK